MGWGADFLFYGPGYTLEYVEEAAEKVGFVGLYYVHVNWLQEDSWFLMDGHGDGAGSKGI